MKYSVDSLIETDVGDLYGAENAADLLLSRGLGLFHNEWMDETWIETIRGMFVCDQHWKELVTQWSSPKFYHLMRNSVNKRVLCTMPNNFDDEHDDETRPYVDRVKRKKFFLTKRQSRAILKEKHYLLHPGIRAFTFGF